MSFDHMIIAAEIIGGVFGIWLAWRSDRLLRKIHDLLTKDAYTMAGEIAVE